MFRAGAFVAEHVSPISPEQIQPNGVDLTLDALATLTIPGHIRRDGKALADREPITPTGDPPEFTLEPGAYIATYTETVTIPDGHIGFVYPRSTLMRNGTMLNTAVWDAGYQGRGQTLLQTHHPQTIHHHARIAQLTLANAEHTDTYTGSYQHENL